MDSSLKNHVLDFFNKYQIESNETFVLAVSTGVDSMAMLHLFQTITSNVIVAHMNHQKREQSKDEEEFIIKYCHERNIKCHTSKLVYDEELNFQSFAREKRYQFFHKVAEAENAKYIVLAHHLDDLAETIIMKMMRSASMPSLVGIKEMTSSQGHFIIRPLLDIRKNTIIEYAKENNVRYYDDYTNDLDIYERNQVRHNVIPELIKIYPDALEKLKAFGNELNNASLIVNQVRDNYIRDYVNVADGIKFSIESFNQLNEYLKYEVLFELLKKYSLSKANIKELLKLIASSKQNIKNWFKNKFTFVKEYDTIIIYDYKIEKNKVNVIINDIKSYPISDKIAINVIKNSANNITNLNQLWYNSEELPIIIRNRQEGDKIKVGKGYKKIKDLLIDEKVGIIKRDNVLLATDKNGEVLIVFGVKRSSLLNKENKDIIVELEERKDG